MNRKNKAIMIAILAFSLLYWYFSAFFSTCSAAEPETLPATITMSREQYRELKTIISEQGQSLTECSQKLKLLEQSSPELIATLIELQVSLANAQKRLQNAEISLTAAQSIIAEQNSSLQTLSEQIKRQLKVQRRREIQNKVWGFAAGFVTAKLVEKIS